LFRAAMGDEPPQAPLPEPSPAEPEVVVKPARVRPGTTGLNGRTNDRLKRGMVEPDARLDLHGLTEAAAHRALLTFVASAQTRGLRLLLVVTGKGTARRRPDHDAGESASGVLKAAVPRWLAERGLVERIADTRLAHRRHGGDGARYIYLRKPPR
jgi:DNA-nicking Smr family endonuclease